MKTMDRVKWILQALIDDMDKLTDWEQKFVISIEEYFKKNTFVTDAQYDKLEEVYTRVQAR